MSGAVVDLEYAFNLAQKLRWTLIGDGYPPLSEDCLVKKDGTFEIYHFNGKTWEHETGTPKCDPSDKWMLMSLIEMIK